MRLEDKKSGEQIGGGFFFDSDKSSEKPTFQYLLKKGIKSESKLIDKLKKYKQVVNEYDKLYKEHISNLDKMDASVQDDIDFNSFHKSFNLIFNKINIREFDDKKFTTEQ